MAFSANTRYNERIRRVLADRSIKELHKLVVNDISKQCNGKKPPVDGLLSLSSQEKRFTCRAINDLNDTLEIENLLDGIIDLFIIITGKPYNGESVEQMVTEIRKVKVFLQQQALLFGLFGEYKELHSAVLYNEVEDYDNETLLNYCIMLFIPFPTDYLRVFEYDALDPLILEDIDRRELVEYTLMGKLANLERLRLHLYIYDVLFGDVDNRLARYEGAPFFYDIQTASEILIRGSNFYYPRVGALSNQELDSRFHPFELLCILSQLDRGRMLIECGWKTGDITSRIITTIYKRAWDDPRILLTPFGTRNSIHSPGYIPQLTLNRDFRHSYDDIRDACQREGIRTEGWKGRQRSMRDLIHDYLVCQLSEDFYLSLPQNKDPREVCLGIYISKSEIIDFGEPRDDLIYFGTRNGTGSFRCMTFKCLADVWTEYNDFVCPFAITSNFSIRSIRRLSFVLSQEGDQPDAQLLMKIVCNLLWSSNRDTTNTNRVDIGREKKYIDEIFDKQERLMTTLRSKYTKSRLNAKLKQIYNLGLFFSEWTDDGPIPLAKDIDIHQVDNLGRARNNALAGLTSIAYSLEDVPELLELKIVRISVEKPISPIGSQEYLDEIAPYPIYEIESDASTIGEYINILVSAHRFGIDELLQHSSIILQMTAEKYGQDITDNSFFYTYTIRVDKPNIDITNQDNEIEFKLDPYLFDIVKGEIVPVNAEDGNWQELPLLTY